MAIISPIERRSFKGRCLIGLIYLLLVAGGVTMVYPFLLMIAGSTKSAVDQKELRILPGYLTDDTLLYRKHIASLFNEHLTAMKSDYHVPQVTSFETLEPPTQINRKLVDIWTRFLDETSPPLTTFSLGHLISGRSRGVQPANQRRFAELLHQDFDGDLDRANRALDAHFPTWHAVRVMPWRYTGRAIALRVTTFQERLSRLAATRPTHEHHYFSLEGEYLVQYVLPQYTRDIAVYNEAHATDYASYDAVRLSRRFPAEKTEAEQEDWLRYVRDGIHMLWLRADAEAAPLYHAYLEAKYRTLDNLNLKYETNYASFDEVPLVNGVAENGLVNSDWETFIQGSEDPDTGVMRQLPPEMITIDALEFRFRDWLEYRYGTIDSLNRDLNTRYGRFSDVFMPQQQLHDVAFRQQTAALRWEYTARNYVTVISFLALHGRALLNTAIYCGLAVLTALIVNPLAAYAMSRFQLPSAYKILLFLMLTMAFPAMVTQIPVFLMLRHFGMLNTFWALILPVAANGYAIFILKGFFDLQPRELYESASLDGAGEWTIFWQITMNLSRPVLAYIGLIAFTAAYGNFMFALLICQDERMWTLMPTLYQLQLRSSSGITFAALIIAAIPTFLVFLFAQNVIMRGIVVPVEK